MRILSSVGDKITIVLSCGDEVSFYDDGKPWETIVINQLDATGRIVGYRDYTIELPNQELYSTGAEHAT